MTSCVIESLFDGRPKELERPDANHSITSRSYSAWLAFVPCGPRRKSRPQSVTIACPLCLCLRYFGTSFLGRGMCRYPFELSKTESSVFEPRETPHYRTPAGNTNSCFG